MISAHRWKIVAFAAALALPALLSGCKHTKPDAFPASGAIAGWEKVGDARVFEAKDLWQYIDGDSEQYLKAGVVSTATCDYKYMGQLEAVVDVHTMRDAPGASKILETSLTKEAKTVQLGDAGALYAQSVIFRKGSHLVRIVAYEPDSNASQALMALARGVEAKL